MKRIIQEELDSHDDLANKTFYTTKEKKEIAKKFHALADSNVFFTLNHLRSAKSIIKYLLILLRIQHELKKGKDSVYESPALTNALASLTLC